MAGRSHFCLATSEACMESINGPSFPGNALKAEAEIFANSMPLEILPLIFSHLNLQEKMNVSLVSKQWNFSVYQKESWISEIKQRCLDHGVMDAQGVREEVKNYYIEEKAKLIQGILSNSIFNELKMHHLKELNNEELENEFDSNDLDLQREQIKKICDPKFFYDLIVFQPSSFLKDELINLLLDLLGPDLIHGFVNEDSETPNVVFGAMGHSIQNYMYANKPLNFNLLKRLIDEGADLSIKNNEDKTAFNYGKSLVLRGGTEDQKRWLFAEITELEEYGKTKSTRP